MSKIKEMYGIRPDGTRIDFTLPDGVRVGFYLEDVNKIKSENFTSIVITEIIDEKELLEIMKPFM